MRVAVEHVRRMRGGAQAHLMRCDDDGYYVTKFQNNPQHLRILANEMLATRLAARMGIAVPQVEVIEVRPELVDHTFELVIQMPAGRVPCSTGKQFGSRFPGHPSKVTLYDSLWDDQLHRVTNLNDFLGIYVFDKWACNTDTRQAVFVRHSNASKDGMTEITYQAMMIDQGFCFDGGNWNFPDAPLRSLYANRRVYQSVVGIESFDPWIERLENEFTMSVLYKEASQVPPEWYSKDHEACIRLIERLYLRRTRVRNLIWLARNAVRDAFPNWKKGACPGSFFQGDMRVSA